MNKTQETVCEETGRGARGEKRSIVRKWKQLPENN